MTDVSTKNKRIEYLDVFKAFGIILMVMGHIEFGTFFSRFIHGFHMPMFFFVSGMLYASTYRRDESRRKNTTWCGFVLKKAKSLLIPYLCFGLLHYALWLSGAGGVQDVQYNRPFEFLTHLFWDNNLGMANAGALWFLTAFFVTEVIYAAIDFKIKGKWKYILFIALGLFGNLFNVIFSFSLPFSIAAGLSGVSLFALGDLFESNKDTNRFLTKISELPLLLTLLLGVVSGAVIMLNKNGVNMRTGAYGNIFLYYIGAITAIFTGINLSKIFLKICRSSKIFDLPRQWLESIGKNSIVYLCLNQVVIVHMLGLFSFISNLYLNKIVILIATLILLFAIDALIRNTGLVFMLGKIRKAGEKIKNFFKKQLPAFVCYILICAMLVGVFAFQYPHKHIDLKNITVALPKISSEQIQSMTMEFGEEELLRESIRLNLSSWYTKEVWDETMSYAYSNNSAISDSQPLTATQKEQNEQYIELLQKGEEIRLPNMNANKENPVRPWAHLCFSQATALYFGLVDDDKVESTTEFIGELIGYLADNHCVNSRSGWGKKRQSALWAENIAFAAWLLWPELSSEAQSSVLRMMILEADRFVDYDVPYYCDRGGNIVYPGDTKGEENAWNSRLLSLAACMLPEYKHAALWEEKSKELLLSSSAVPSDINNPEWSDILNGSNINEDGTVVSHSRIHIDYSSCIMEGMIDTYLIYSLAGKEIPKEATHNFDKMYSALVNLDLGAYDESKSGAHFYERDEENTPTAAVNMPGDNDWGGNWYGNYFLNDIIADRLKMDADCPEGLKAADWAKVHLETISSMLKRTHEQHIQGQFFVPGENNFISGEAYQTQCMMKAYMLLMFTTPSSQ